MNTFTTSTPRHEPVRGPAWRPGVWTFSLVIVWLALLGALMLVGSGEHPADVPAAEEPYAPII